MDIVGRILDRDQPPLVVAEMSGNHGGSLQKALNLVDAAFQAGADALKLQTYKPETITVRGNDNRFIIKEGLWSGKTLSELYEEAMTPWEWHSQIFEKAKNLGMFCFSSPFDESAVDFLESELNPPVYKIASFELNHYPLLIKIARLGKPVIASVGVSSEEEVRTALEILKENGSAEVFLLHCVSEYPAQPSDFCLNLMPELGQTHGVVFGLSDHSLGHLVSVAATALGARLIEKHLCLDRELSSVDGGFSMLPNEFAEMTSSVHCTYKSTIGKKLPSNPAFYKRSILISEPVRKGECLDEKNLRIARPGDGLCPSKWEQVLGSKATKDMKVGHPLSLDDIC